MILYQSQLDTQQIMKSLHLTLLFFNNILTLTYDLIFQSFSES